jgi:ABC-type lipoprotein release transport system permease subunit
VAVGLGITAGIFMTAFYMGMAEQRIDKVIRTEISHIQVHHREFRENNDINKLIPDARDITAGINNLAGVEGAASRLIISSMVASAETSAGIKISGIIPEEEVKVTNLHEKITEGNYLTAGKRYPVLLSRKLASKLKVRLGSKVVITLQDIHNNITSGAFRISGIFDTKSTMYDESNIFIRYDDLAGLMDIPAGSSHEIAVRAVSNDQVLTLRDQLIVKYPELEIIPWFDLSPEIGYLNEAMDLYMYIFIMIILFALLFGLVNTMLMVVLERIKEIGMLMAVGMNRIRIFSMIVLETVFLAMTGGVVGILAGTLISKYYESHKIDLSFWGPAYEDLGYDAFVYTSLNLNLLINVTILVLITGILGSLYPAYRALQNNPAEALRIE